MLKRLLLFVLLLAIPFTMATTYVDNNPDSTTVLFPSSMATTTLRYSMDIFDFGTTNNTELGVTFYYKPLPVDEDEGYESPASFAGRTSVSRNFSTFVYGEEEYETPTSRLVQNEVPCYDYEQRVIYNNQHYCVLCNGQIKYSDKTFTCLLCPLNTEYKDGRCKVDLTKQFGKVKSTTEMLYDKYILPYVSTTNLILLSFILISIFLFATTKKS